MKTPIKRNTDGTFGPTKKKHYYKPISYHNTKARKNEHKTKWIVKENEQYLIFKISDENDWLCNQNQGLFSISINPIKIVGNGGEILSFFPKPNNVVDPWHGFPVMSESKTPSRDLLKKWIDDEVIDLRIKLKILKGQL